MKPLSTFTVPVFKALAFKVSVIVCLLACTSVIAAAKDEAVIVEIRGMGPVTTTFAEKQAE